MQSYNENGIYKMKCKKCLKDCNYIGTTFDGVKLHGCPNCKVVYYEER